MVRNPDDTGRPPWTPRVRPHGRHVDILSTCVLLVGVFTLAGCATQGSHSSVAQPLPRPTTETTAAPVAAIAATKLHKHEQKKKDVTVALAENSLDSLPSSEVGYYMDVMQGRLKQVVDKHVSIRRQGDHIVLDLSFLLGFESGSAQPNPGVSEILTALSEVLVEYRKTVVSIHAFADESGSEAITPRLAEQRALAVARYLTGVGVASKRIVIAELGAGHAPKMDVSPENRTQVELQVEPIMRLAVNER
jgi:outer membrane protein OmpA-like peptidoglycan-associated protein